MEELKVLGDITYLDGDVYHVDFNRFNTDSEFDIEEDTSYEEEIYEQIAQDLKDGEVRLAIDDNSEDKQGAFLFYKKGEEFFVDYLYAEDGGDFVFANDFLYWYTNYHREMTVSEETEFLIALSDYIKNSKVPLQATLTLMQRRKMENPVKADNLPSEKQDNYKMAAQIIKTSGVVLGMILALVCVIVEKGVSSVLFGFGLGYLIYTVYLFVVIGLKLRHAFCLVQLLNKHKMTPNEVNWKLYPSVEKYFKPLTYLVVSAVLILISFI